ncbi:MAG TPA: methyltransferase domain-containing protein [Myxococcota bacterium]|jgi:hypothetical protein
MSLLLNRALYFADLGIGRMLGARCPNCSRRPERPPLLNRHHGLSPVYACEGCGLYYRPAAFRGGRVLELYYSLLYNERGITTEMPAEVDRSAILASVLGTEKDRAPEVRRLLGSQRANICVWGCSWGYELLPLVDLGHRVVGIEIGSTRRAFGRDRLGLEIVATAGEAAASLGSVDLLLSSHVLEHVPRLDHLLDQVDTVLAPRRQLHFTPSVEDVGRNPLSDSLIGREHPLGVTRRFWEGRARRSGLDLAFEVRGQSATSCGEACAVLTRGAS